MLMHEIDLANLRYDWKSGTLIYKPNRIKPEYGTFYLFNLEAVV